MIVLPSKKKLFCLTAAAAFSSSAQAWVLPAAATTTTTKTTSVLCRAAGQPTSFLTTPYSHSHNHNHHRVDTRLYSSSRNNNNNDNGDNNNGSLLSKISSKVKSILPTKWFGTKKEKEAQIVKKQAKEQVTGGIQEMLKDAPLGIRMMGKMIAPLVGKMASNMAVTMKDQQEKMKVIMEDTQRYLVSDDAVTSVLGEPIRMGTPFSQSQSTSSINGKTQSRMQLGIPVTGSKGSGVARVLATQDGIAQLQVEVEGQEVINVNLSSSRASAFAGSSSSNRRSSSSGKFSASKSSQDNIIEAEIIEKETK
jgi:hypothetical protein